MHALAEGTLMRGEFKEADHQDAMERLDHLKQLRKQRLDKAKRNERLLIPRGRKRVLQQPGDTFVFVDANLQHRAGELTALARSRGNRVVAEVGRADIFVTREPGEPSKLVQWAATLGGGSVIDEE